MNGVSKVKWQEAFIIICLLLHNVLDIYAINDNLTFGNIADLLVFGLCFFTNNERNEIPVLMWGYILYRIIMSFLTSSSLTSMIPVGFILQVLALFAAFRSIRLTSLIRIYKGLGYFVTLFLLIQYISFTVFGFRISGILRFLPIAIGGDDFLLVMGSRVRQASIFSEPAHFAEFILPLLCILLFDEEQKKSWLLIALCMVSLLLSMSGTALLGLLVVFLLYIMKLLVARISSKKIFLLYFIILALPVGLYYYSQSEIGESVLSRTESVRDAQNATSASSEYVRIFRGYDVFGELETINKVFGCGNRDKIIESIPYSFYYSLFDGSSFYFNGISTILLYTGIIGLLLYVLALLSIWKNNSFCGRSFLVLLVPLMMIASIVLNSTGVLLLLLASLYKKKTLYNNSLTK